MTTTAPPPRQRVPADRLEWLSGESARWRADGLLDEGVRAAILAKYEAETPQNRGMQVLVVLGILICAVGLLLLIAYNWSAMPAASKLGMIVMGVAGAFGASARAYATGRASAGEALAFTGVLSFANGIWLIAQVLHIQGHFPDAFLWSALGALACAWLLRSVWNGVLAAAFLVCWCVAEGLVSPGDNYLFLPLWAATVLLARATDSRAMTALGGIAIVAWVAVLDQAAPGPLWLATLVLCGCALYMAGTWQSPVSRAAVAWQLTGIGVLLVLVVPLMIVDVQRTLVRGGLPPPALMAASVAAAAFTLSGLLRAATQADWAIGGVALATCAWAGASGLGFRSPLFGAVLFSVVALVLAVSMVNTGLATSRLPQFVTGVFFAAAFLLVRWMGVVENALLSGLLLLAAGGGLLFLARLWRTRDSRAAAGGTA